VLVLGAGVAGLQAIATARRLGAVVEAYDARPVVKEQVESLGAKFIEIDVGGEDMQTAGGYAREMTPDELRRQQEALNEHIARFDVVITTALVPGRPAPRLIPAVAVEKMRTGSVIVDLAAETGGNCELTVPGEIVEREGVTIIGLLNLPALIPVHASQMYSRVIQNLLGLLVKDGAIDLNMEDEIFQGICITRDGEIIQPQTRKAMGLDAAPEAAPAPVSTPVPEATEGGAGGEEIEADLLEDATIDAGGDVVEDNIPDDFEVAVVTPADETEVIEPSTRDENGDVSADVPAARLPVQEDRDVGIEDLDDAVEVRVKEEYVPGVEEVRLEPADTHQEPATEPEVLEDTGGQRENG
jgi:hypothetical protein